MHFCIQQVHNWLHQDSVATVVDAASAAARRRKSRDRRRSPATAPKRPSQPPPQRPSRPPPQPATPKAIPAAELSVLLRPHLLTHKSMLSMGYPLDIDPTSEIPKAVVYYTPPPRPKSQYTSTVFDVNAPEFVPGGSQSDSGQGSLGSSPRSDSDEETDTVKRLCVRCDKIFKMTRDGEYADNSDSCHYHWGRFNPDGRYACCRGYSGVKGCETSRHHVWNGTYPGMNGPLDGYVRPHARLGGVLALDTEMCYTTAGLELASIALVGVDGKAVYSELVKPRARIVDANTRFSGITKTALQGAKKTLPEIQKEILERFIGTDTILIGHALDNDLRVMKLLHNLVVDTCVMYPHTKGLPARRSLRVLCQEVLSRSIQEGSHCAEEDAKEALNLVLHKVHEERKARARVADGLSMLQPYDPLLCAA